MARKASTTRYGEASFKADEKAERGDKGCHICGINGHLPDQARVARELDTSRVVYAGLASEECGLVCKCWGHEIDLLLDTGTVSNLGIEDQREVGYDIRSKRAALVGVGGARVTMTETG